MAWIDLMASDDVVPGGIVTIELERSEIVVWRAGNGAIAACDARCPHQWAHLGAAGVVDGDELVCLSHAWRFDVDGVGSKLAASGRRDEKGSAEVVPVRELDGRIQIDTDEGVLRIGAGTS